MPHSGNLPIRASKPRISIESRQGLLVWRFWKIWEPLSDDLRSDSPAWAIEGFAESGKICENYFRCRSSHSKCSLVVSCVCLFQMTGKERCNRTHNKKIEKRAKIQPITEILRAHAEPKTVKFGHPAEKHQKWALNAVDWFGTSINALEKLRRTLNPSKHTNFVGEYFLLCFFGKRSGNH